MRNLILSTLLLSSAFHTALGEVLEFPAGSTTSIEIPANASVIIDNISYKGDAWYSKKLQLKIGEVFHDLTGFQFGRGYINGPATLSSQALVSARSSGIRYKLGYDGNSVNYDLIGDGSFGAYTTIPFAQGNSDYQTYLAWLNAGNTPLPADAYTGTDANIAESGALIDFTRLSNQPFKNIIVSKNAPQTLVIPAGKKLKIPHNQTGSSISTSTSTSIFPGFLEVTMRGGYRVDYFSEIDGPEVLTLTYTVLGAGGSANSTSGSQASGDIFTYYFSDEYSEPVADSLVNAIATKITSTAGSYGIATKSELNTALTQSRADGINSVLSNPNLWTLYTTSQIQNMAVGDLVLTRQVGGGFVLNYDIEQSTDLQTWTTYEALSLPLEGLPTDKAFVRIKAKQ